MDVCALVRSVVLCRRCLDMSVRRLERRQDWKHLVINCGLLEGQAEGSLSWRAAQAIKVCFSKMKRACLFEVAGLHLV